MHKLLIVHANIVKCLLSSGADINLCEILEKSPLYVASEKGHCDVVKCLLSSGADIKLSDKYGQSPLFPASYISQHHIVLAVMLKTMVIVQSCYAN
jgi:ankyrin repeat protein